MSEFREHVRGTAEQVRHGANGIVKIVGTSAVLAGIGIVAADRTGASIEGPRHGVRAEQSSMETTKDAQKGLKALGLYDGEIDGRVGPKTREAIGDFQEQYMWKENQNGQLDELTISSIATVSGHKAKHRKS